MAKDVKPPDTHEIQVEGTDVKLSQDQTESQTLEPVEKAPGILTILLKERVEADYARFNLKSSADFIGAMPFLKNVAVSSEKMKPVIFADIRVSGDMVKSKELTEKTVRQKTKGAARGVMERHGKLIRRIRLKRLEPTPGDFHPTC